MEQREATIERQFKHYAVESYWFGVDEEGGVLSGSFLSGSVV